MESLSFLFVLILSWDAILVSSHLCPDVNDAVCGEDGQIYQNPCLLRNAGTVEAKDWNVCKSISHKDGEVDSVDCPRACPYILDEVCGSDNRIYANPCELKRINCGKKIRVIPFVECKKRSPL